MGLIRSLGGMFIGSVLPQRSYWAAKRSDGKWLCELDRVSDGKGGTRPLDWTLDLASAGDLAQPDKSIKELWLFCPPTSEKPLGQSDFVRVEKDHPAFQLKVGMLYAWGAEGRTMEAQLIGRVEDLASGACTCKVWDAEAQLFGDWESNVRAMGSWRDGIGSLGALDVSVLGVHGMD